MVDTKTPGEKPLGMPSKTLSLKPRVETGTVRQSFSHGRSKQVVVEKHGKRRQNAEPHDLEDKPGQDHARADRRDGISRITRRANAPSRWVWRPSGAGGRPASSWPGSS